MAEDTVKKILAIEESVQTRNLFLECFEAKGFYAIGAENGAIALQQVQKQLPDIIVCGIARIGELDGFSVLTAIRKNPNTAVIPFIFVTSRTSRDDIRKGMELGADDYLTKPCTLKELMRAIDTQLEKRAILQRWYTSNSQLNNSELAIAEASNATTLHSIFPASTQMVAVFRFIEENYWQPITLCDIARSVGYSPAYLTNLVRQQTGKSVHRWLVERRMAQAICLLQKTEQTIGQIAETIGYQDVCHFSRYFRQFYGTSPQAWRNEHRCRIAAVS
jgi:YesN/AraC family two-component response regulator